MWGFRKPKAQEMPQPDAPAEVGFTTMPPIINPTTDQNRTFAQWRVDHITRWLDDPTNRGAPADKVRHLMSERDQYRAMLAMMG